MTAREERAREVLAAAYERANLICPAADVRAHNKIDWVRESVALDAIAAAFADQPLAGVTDADREAAAHAGASIWNPLWADELVASCRRGARDDTDLVQAFARHRQAGFVAGMQRAAEIADEAGRTDEAERAVNPQTILCTNGHVIAAAIRQDGGA